MLAYEVTGSGPALVLLHGFMQTRRSWDEVRSLLPPDRRVVTVDLPGHGQSRAAEASLPAAAAGLAAIWEQLGLDAVDLAGYSLGGRVALWTAVAHPDRVRSLLTLGAHAGFEGEVRERRRQEDEALAERIEREGIDWFAAYWAERPLFAGLARRGSDLLVRLDAMRRAQDAQAIARALRGMGGAAAEPFWDRLPAISSPSTFVAGADDSAYVEAAARLAIGVTDGRVEIVEGAGHAAHLEQPSAFAAVLRRHLEAHSATR